VAARLPVTTGQEGEGANLLGPEREKGRVSSFYFVFFYFKTFLRYLSSFLV
jgi:hypothetical protein